MLLKIGWNRSEKLLFKASDYQFKITHCTLYIYLAPAYLALRSYQCSALCVWTLDTWAVVTPHCAPGAHTVICITAFILIPV